jgi:transcriptional regulator with XRE-family HTH domain
LVTRHASPLLTCPSHCPGHRNTTVNRNAFTCSARSFVTSLKRRLSQTGLQLKEYLVMRVIAVSPTGRATRQTVGAYVRNQRRRRGWSQLRLIHALRLASAHLNWQLPDDASMIASLSRWENGHRRPGEFYRRLLCMVFGLAPGTLDGDLASLLVDEPATVSPLADVA